MKKLLSFAIVVSLLLALPLFATADNRVHVDGAGLSLTLTDDYYVFTQETPDDYIGWEALGIDPDTLKQSMIEDGTYLDSLSQETACEIVITQATNEEREYVFNYALYEDEDLAEIFDAMEEELLRSGITPGEMNIYKSGDVKYIYCQYKLMSDGAPVGSILYSTVYNGQLVTFAFHSYYYEIDDYAHEHFRNIIDSVEFDKKLEPSGPTAADQKAGFTESIVDGAVEGAIKGAGAAVIVALIAGVVGVIKKKKNNNDDNS